MTVSRHDEPASFFDHLSHLSAEYERLQGENRSLRAALHQAGSEEHGDVAIRPSAPSVRREAHHGALDDYGIPTLEEVMEEDMKYGDHRHDVRPAGSSRRHSRVSESANVSNLGANRRTRAIFGNGDDIKAAIQNELAEPRYDVKNMYKTSGWAQYVAKHTWFDNFTMGVIVVYAIYMSVDADWNSATIITQTHPVFIAAEQIFCLYFFVELLIRFLAFERKRNCFRDGWFVFDFVLVVMMVAETWIMNLVIIAMASMSGDSSDANFLGDAAILRMARLMRLTRLLRMARLIRMVPELLIMVKAIASAGRSVGFTLVLLGISLYVFAIAFRMSLEGTNVGANYFGNVAIAMHSLFMHGTFLDAVSDVMSEMLEESILGFALMYIFIILSAVTIMNMLIGILCEVITAVADAEKEALQVSWTTEVLQTCLSAGADTNNDGCIDIGEFQSMIQNQQVRKVLREVDVDVQTLVNFADVLFEDEDGQSRMELPFADFMQRLLQLRGRNTATVKDLVDLRKWMSRELQSMASKMQHNFFSPITPVESVIVHTASRLSPQPLKTKEGWGSAVPGQVP
mmetsp:Transcript_56407/g.131778  ORF Transcript_56407/g.131778 Transcript_56407/m.131778 type:complete len:571 (+) Transcript_56407:88-1800(+)